ncbi:putative autophagy-related protein 12 [Hyaloraphidium curvatum]|nr:putative autophagy-related protein 12 [Hyaloraphidium curvatum]
MASPTPLVDADVSSSPPVASPLLPAGGTANPPQPSQPPKVVVHLRPTGNAPILKQSFFRIAASHRFGTVADFVRKQLGVGPNDALFLYVNSAFAPSPDEDIGNLHRCFRDSKGDLVVNYCLTPAWG